MTVPNLVLRYTIDGDTRVHTTGAVRIKLDGKGGLTVYRSEDGGQESVSLVDLSSLTIQSIPDLRGYTNGMIH